MCHGPRLQCDGKVAPENLTDLVGAKPVPRTELARTCWQYIKKNQLQDKRVKTQLNAVAVMLAVLEGFIL